MGGVGRTLRRQMNMDGDKGGNEEACQHIENNLYSCMMELRDVREACLPLWILLYDFYFVLLLLYLCCEHAP